jgi:hypothetical protein
MKFTKRFRTQEEYDAFIADGGVRIPTISAIDNPLDFKVDNPQFPLDFYSEDPVIVDEGFFSYAHFYVKPNVNIYDKFFYLLSYTTDAPDEDLPEELLNLYTFHVNGNEVIAIWKPQDFKYGDRIEMRFKETWEPIKGYEFVYGHEALGFLSSDGQIEVQIEVRELN